MQDSPATKESSSRGRTESQAEGEAADTHREHISTGTLTELPAQGCTLSADSLRPTPAGKLALTSASSHTAVHS